MMVDSPAIFPLDDGGLVGVGLPYGREQGRSLSGFDPSGSLLRSGGGRDPRANPQDGTNLELAGVVGRSNLRALS